jgi:HNH endonuclease
MTLLDVTRQQALLLCIRLPPAQTMVARKSTLTNAFVSALIPRIEPTVEEIDEALTILALDPFDLRCAYCGNPYDTWDHLRPLVTARRPTGYITEIANLVPACNRCNSSKGKSHWKEWMFGQAKGSPLYRQIAELESRAVRLTAYENWRQPVKVDFGAILGDADWQQYWSLCDAVVADLQAAQAVADRLQERVVATIKAHRKS